MIQPTPAPASPAHYELRFVNLFNAGRGFAFPCDIQGQVDIGALSERGRCNYFYARVVIGHELSLPVVALVV
jgi:hypothetical protein